MSALDSDPSTTMPSTPTSAFSTLSSVPSQAAPRRYNALFRVQTVVFEAGGEIFEVLRYGVPQTPIIAAFEEKFPCSREDPTCPGTSADNPITVDMTEVEFCSLLKAIYPPPGQTELLEMPSQEWVDVFRIAKRHDLELLKTTAFKRVEGYASNWMKAPIDKIKFGRDLGESKWVKDGFKMLVVRDETLTKEEIEYLTAVEYLRLLELRDHIWLSAKRATVASRYGGSASEISSKKQEVLTDKILCEKLGDILDVNALNPSV